ncbi:uncharacterized protein [Epargyreus clarus]|uniref:uncharacterized protein n=1 Tax=Epargyreus clarus TaxID=520877 RepID=UPI003C2B13D7
MVITRKLKYDTPRLVMGGVGIGVSQEIKLLGLTIDNKLTFKSHTAKVCKKALNFYKQLSRAAKIHWGLNSEIVRIIYTAVVEPTIMYAASAWAPATERIGIRKELDCVQRGFVQKIIKGYKTISLNSALLLAGLLPLDIRIREAASLYEIKKGYTRRVVGDRDVEVPIPYKAAPHPAQWIPMSFGIVADEVALKENLNASLNIFTDGSKIEGKVGAALSIRHGNEEICTRKLRLEDCCTVFQAELLALAEATQEAIKRKHTSCSVFCDSRSALEIVTNISSLHPLAISIKNNIAHIQSQGKKLNLYWIKAHIGLEGNERADELAKDAALQLKVKAKYDRCPVSFVKRVIRADSIHEWNRRYQEVTQGSTTKAFFPDAIKAYPILKNIKLNNKLVQMFTGHGGFSSYLHRFKCKESPSCVCDSDVEESALHIITECPVYSTYRNDIETELNIEIKRNTLSNILEDKTNRVKFLEYCEVIINKVNNINK